MVNDDGTREPLPAAENLVVSRLGDATHASPLRGDDTFVDEEARIWVATATDETSAAGDAPSFEAAGPRERLGRAARHHRADERQLHLRVG